MMKLLLFLLFMIFMIINVNVKICQFFIQILFYFIFIFMLISYSYSNMNFWMKIYYNMGLDFYSMGMNLLSLWILGLMVMVGLNNYMSIYSLNYSIIILLLLLFLILCFQSMNFMMFYLYFESSLIPIFFLIMGWGFQVDRIQASYYMMLYTLLGSMPLFFMLIYLYNMLDTLMMMMIKFKINVISYFMLILAFLIKLPIYFVHLWLPKAHVEAPLVGSMILAAIMLKLGGYGLLRLMLMMKYICMKFNIYIIIISILGGIYSSLICLYQIDLKMLVAYSSVVHMSMLLGGMMTLSNLGYYGGFLMMIAHGLCSSGLFILVNINYERLNSRSIYLNKGMINFMPSLSLMWFLLVSSNLSFPPSLGLFSEIMLLSSLLIYSYKFMILLFLLMYLSSLYSLYLYSFSQHGDFNKIIIYMKKIYVGEYMVLILHWIPLNFLFIMMMIYM